jgi:hypothetical protein
MAEKGGAAGGGGHRGEAVGGERRWGARGSAGDGEVESAVDAPRDVGIRSSRN